MSTALGSAILAGNPSESSAGNTNAGSAPPAPPAPPPPSSGGSWMDAINDADLKGYVQNKGWNDPVELANGYRNLEKLLGGEKLPMPKGADDADGWSRVYDALGRPKSANDYKFEGMPEDADSAFLSEASNWMHEAGLSQRQAQLMAEKWNAYAQSLTENQSQSMAAESQRQLDTLKNEWGGAWDENVELGRRAARQFGINQDVLVGIEQAIGAGEMLKLMSRIGRGLTEHSFEGGNTISGFGMTPEAARQRINSLKADRDWSAKYLSGNADAKAELARLMSVAFPDQQ